MSLSTLATVELQLVFHCCDTQSALVLARCSRFTLLAASNSFAWLSPINLDWQKFLSHQCPSSSLLRFAPVTLLWNLDATVQTSQAERQAQYPSAAFLQTFRLHGLIIAYQGPMHKGAHLHSCSDLLQPLCEIEITNSLVHLSMDRIEWTVEWMHWFARPLRHMHSLTSLKICSASMSDRSGCMLVSAVADLQRVTNLELPFNFLASATTLALASFLRTDSCPLMQLSICGNDAPVADLLVLLEVILANPRVKHADLSKNSSRLVAAVTLAFGDSEQLKAKRPDLNLCIGDWAWK
jgi:hypothetical protein